MSIPAREKRRFHPLGASLSKPVVQNRSRGPRGRRTGSLVQNVWSGLFATARCARHRVSTEMGRHKSSLRELGWGVSNSPNPWKQGSAKRVVRTLDYSNVECEAEKEIRPAVAEPAVPTDRAWEDRLQQLQQDGETSPVPQSRLLAWNSAHANAAREEAHVWPAPSVGRTGASFVGARPLSKVTSPAPHSPQAVNSSIAFASSLRSRTLTTDGSWIA